MGHFVSLKYFSSKEIKEIISLSAQIKKDPRESQKALSGKRIGLLFEKPSLRTKTAFYVGALQLGAEPVYYSPEEIKLGKREKISDVAQTLSLYLNAVVLRTFSHDSILEFVKSSSVPVINGLSDSFHPSQALADILTIIELKGNIKKVKITYIGDGNNVCTSLLYAVAILGGKLNLAMPKKYYPSKSILKEVKSYSDVSKADIKLSTSVEQAVYDVDVLYTDVWTSMGHEKEARKRKKAFRNFQVNNKLLKLAKKDAIVMHCLPARRGEEITDSVIDGESSVVLKQAENRLYTAKAILTYILKR